MDLLPKTPETSVSVHATTSAWSRNLRSVPSLTFEKVHLLLKEIGGTGKTKEKATSFFAESYVHDFEGKFLK